LAFKVIEFGASQEPVYNFLLVINSNLGLVSHRYCVRKNSFKTYTGSLH